MKKVLILILLFLSSPAFAVIEDKDVCFYHTSKAEIEKNIKKNILSTISLVETGRMSKDKVIGNPWPWTIAYQGKGHYFNTKNEAVQKVKKLQKQGIKSIDVGCMQVNLFYHGNAFATIEEAFEPSVNVDYAGDFVNRLYKKHGNWGAAATAYHSHNPEKAHKYEDKLIKVWASIEKHLASGGKLHNVPKSVKLANALEVKKDAPQPRIQKEVIANKKSPQIKEVSENYELSSAEYASQWRARKLTEYRLRRGTKIQN